jgi:Zn-dependent protease
MTAPANTDAEAPPSPAISPIAVLLVLGWLALGAALSLVDGLTGPLTYAFVLVGWVLTVMAHEFGHALTAWLGGDRTVAAKGYLSLDPRRYLDAGTSLVIPIIVLAIGGIGLPGGAVYLRPDLMRGPFWRAAASLAGPAMTFAALLLLSGAVLAVEALAPHAEGLICALAFLAFLQATAFVLNILPVPGLDGYGALRALLPVGLAHRLRKLEGLVFLGFVVLLLTPSPLNRLVFEIADVLAELAGVPRDLIIAGYRAFHFWG